MENKKVLARFRTALAGFHKGDVAEYLAALHLEHQAAREALEQKCAALEQENARLRQALDADRLEQLERQNRELTQQLERQNGDPELRERELEAYRRAEAMERRASRHLHQVKEQVEQIAGPLVRELNGTVDTARNALEAIDNRLSALQAASGQLGTAMEQGTEKLEAMASDPAAEE